MLLTKTSIMSIFNTFSKKSNFYISYKTKQSVIPNVFIYLSDLFKRMLVINLTPLPITPLTFWQKFRKGGVIICFENGDESPESRVPNFIKLFYPWFCHYSNFSFRFFFADLSKLSITHQLVFLDVTRAIERFFNSWAWDLIFFVKEKF